MIPGINPRQMKQVMKQMGMSVNELDAEEVIIKTSDKELVFKNPQVQQMKIKNEETFQIIGNYEVVEREIEVNISEEDIKTVQEQANVSEEEARKALENTKGDIAEAIIYLTEKNN